jgi:hypothetical protein
MSAPCFRSLGIAGALAIGLAACGSQSNPGTTPAGGTGGASAGGIGGDDAGAVDSGRLGTGGGAGVGGTSGGTGGGAGGSNSGAGGTAAPTSFVCNQVTAMTLTREWYEAGFEGVVPSARWQLKAREHGYITEWSNPASDFWNEMIESPCAQGSTAPDHVVLTVLSWAPACCVTQPQWQTQINGAINNLTAKYPSLRRIDLMTVIRGPGNALCPTAPAVGETIVIPPELDQALAAAAVQFPDLVFVAPKFEAPDCAAFSGGGPHLTSAGNAAVAAVIGAYFATIQ